MCVEHNKERQCTAPNAREVGDKAVLGKHFSFLGMPGSRKPVFDRVRKVPIVEETRGRRGIALVQQIGRRGRSTGRGVRTESRGTTRWWQHEQN